MNWNKNIASLNWIRSYFAFAKSCWFVDVFNACVVVVAVAFSFVTVNVNNIVVVVAAAVAFPFVAVNVNNIFVVVVAVAVAVAANKII